MASDSETLDAITPMEVTDSPSIKRPPKKIYVPIRIQTNALNNDDIAINATYISIEDLPASRKKRNKARNIEIRYLESIRSLRNKIKSSYSCNQDHCPLIKERRDHHQKEHHQNHQVESRQSGNLSNSQANCCSHHDRQSQTNFQPMPDSIQDSKETSQQCVTLEPPDKKSVAITPAASILKRTSTPRLMKSHSIQTPAKSVDFNHPIQSIFDNECSRSDGQTQYKNDANSKPMLVENETANTPNNSYLRSDLVIEIQNWFEDIPVYPNLSSTSKHLRKTMVNDFIDKIFELSNYADGDSYEKNVKIEIDNLLNILPMWYPGAKRDQDVLKESIRNNLLGKIKKLRSKNSCEAEVMPYVSDIMVNKDENIGLEDSNRLNKYEGKEKLIESQVLDWLMQIKIKENTEIVKPKNIIEAANIFTKRLMPLFDKPSCSENNKLILKGLIVDTLNDLPNILHSPKHKRMYLNRIAEDLSNRLLCIQSKFKHSFDCCYLKESSSYQLSVCSKAHFKKVLQEGLYEYLEKVSPEHPDDVKEEITDILIDCLESISFHDNIENRNEIIQTVFPNSAKKSETQPYNIIIRNISELQTDKIMKKTDHLNNLEPSCHSGVLAVFTSEHELTGKFPVSSTPKKKSSLKEVPRLNREEISYMDDIATLVRVWIETLPRKFDEKENRNFKETIIRDLAGDIMDQVKIEQLAPQARSDRDKCMFYIIFRWLYRFDVIEDLNDANPYVEDLMQKLHDVPVPTLTRSQRGSRQAMANIKHMEGENAWKDDFVPTGLDVLQDEISIWMNEQPSTIYSKTDKDFREKMVHELAETIQVYIISKKPEQEIVNELSKWLRKMLKSSENNKISELAENLKLRIAKLPQDATLAEKIQKKIHQRGEAVKTHCDPCKCAHSKTNNGPTIDPDRTLIEFINKFMERNYEVDDSLARGAFEELLKTEFQKLTPPTRKEVYDNFSKSTKHDQFSPERLEKELQYIKDVSDWLKNIPIDSSFNMPQNKQRIEFVNDLARNIYEVEESRRKEPTAMDYNMYLASIISQFTDQLPILPQHTGNVMLMIDQLIGKIVASRTPMPCCQNAFKENTSFSSTGIQEQSITEFIDKYIHLNAGEIADDPVKLEAWSARMLKEVKKIVRDTANPSTLCKTQVYNNLINVPIPEDETVRIFGLELDYAKEISDWLHNLPLLTISSPEASEQRVKMISDLAEMFAERERNKVASPTQEQQIDKIEEYIENWIHQLPLDSNREIVMPLVIKQLIKRINRVNSGPEEIVLSEVSPAQSTTTSRKTKSKAKKKKSCKPTCSNSRPKTKQSGGQIVVDAIENWSKNLPVKAENEDIEKEIKDKVTRKLFQKVGELNDDPVIMNDDILYEELLRDEVNLQLNSLPQNADMEKKKENLKNDIVDKVMEAKSIIKENVAGEKYKHQLENTIDASIPNPIINKQWHDPGFEIYRDRLADMFILENCDHGSDDVKANYEKRIKTEINKYFQDAQKRNAAPLSRDQIYSELYGALFKVPMPSEYSTADEVERIKTRCELDEWFYGLPLREALNTEEILEKEKILSMLAKRLHEIEKSELKPDEKIHQEITKWIRKLPLLPGNESSIDNFAVELENKLKSTKEDRKYVPASPLNPMGSNVKHSNKSKEKEHKGSKTKGVLGTSQVAGPSSAGHMWTSPSPAVQTCCQSSVPPRKKPAEIIFAIVEHWAENLPFYENTPKAVENNKVIRDDLVTKIIMKLSELNSDPRTFSDDMLYNYLFDQHLEKIMANLPICCDFQKTKDAKKLELIEAVHSVKPLIKEDRARHEYKEELKTTVNSILKEPLDTTAHKIAMFQEIREEIVNNFVQYNYNIDDDEGKQIYKTKLREAVTKYFLEVKDSPDDPPVDPLVRQNQLLCELAKIEIPSERAVKEEVEEIRMKDEVRQFFDELSLPEENEEKMVIRNKIMLSLGKRLNEIEKTGHNCKNNAKMKKEIERYLKKLNVELDQGTIQSFIDKLKITEAWRKAPPAGKTDTCLNAKVYHQTNLDSGPHDYNHSGPKNQTENYDRQNNLVVNVIPPTTKYIPNQDTDTNNRQGSSVPCPQGYNNAKSLGVTPEYEGFGGGVALSSSPQPTDHQSHDLPANNQPRNLVNLSPDSQEAPNSEVPSQDATTQGMNRRFEAKKRNRRPGTTSEEEVTDEECNCMIGRRKLKGRPRCVLKRPAFCDDCNDYGRMWIPMPPYKYPLGYFYY